MYKIYFKKSTKTWKKSNTGRKNADFTSAFFCSSDYTLVLSFNGFVMSKHTSILDGVILNWNEESCDKRINERQFLISFVRQFLMAFCFNSHWILRKLHTHICSTMMQCIFIDRAVLLMADSTLFSFFYFIKCTLTAFSFAIIHSVLVTDIYSFYWQNECAVIAGSAAEAIRGEMQVSNPAADGWLSNCSNQPDE